MTAEVYHNAVYRRQNLYQVKTLAEILKCEFIKGKLVVEIIGLAVNIRTITSHVF